MGVQNAVVGNNQTSIAGALVGLLNYITNNGTSLPSTKQEWANTGISLGIAILGFLAKDAKTGSQAA